MYCLFAVDLADDGSLEVGEDGEGTPTGKSKGKGKKTVAPLKIKINKKKRKKKNSSVRSLHHSFKKIRILCLELVECDPVFGARLTEFV